MRSELLEQLRAFNITKVTAEYSGSGDEGFIDQIMFEPDEPSQPMRRDLDDFFWEEVIQNHHCGFHDGDGGYGDLVWDITTDKIVLHHRDYIQDEYDFGEKEID